MKTKLSNINYKFLIFEIIFVSLIFLLNINHENQQGTYYNVFLQIANNIKNGFGYSTEYNNTIPSFYPLWGYTFFTLLDLTNNGIIPLILQFILTFIGIELLFSIFKIEKKIIYLLGLLPFIAIMSMKAPDAIVAFLLILFVYNFSKISTEFNKYVVFSGISLGLIYNFRSEYSILIVLIIIFSLILKNYRKYTKNLLIIGIIAYCFIMPWSIRSYILNGEYLSSATNGGAVAYITLGQLPNNKWNIMPNDTSALSMAQKIGEKNQYTPKSDKYFQNLFIESVEKEKFEFIKKSAFNFAKVFYSGVYTGEYKTLAYDTVSKKLFVEIDNTSGTFNKIKKMFEIPLKSGIFLIIDKSVYLIFMIINFSIILVFLRLLFSKEYWKSNLIGISIFSVFILKIMVVSFLQYEYRHINPLYTLIYFPVVKFLIEQKLWKKKANINQ